MRGRRPSASSNASISACTLLDLVGHGGRLPLVDAGDGLDLGAVAAEHLLHRVGNLADGGLGARRLDRQRQQVAVAVAGAARQRRQRGLDVLLVALGLRSRVSLSICSRAHRGVVDLEHVDRASFDPACTC